MTNFITLILILLAEIGLIIHIAWYWLITVYFGVMIVGLIIVYIIERLGLWQVDWIQTWKMAASELFKQQSEYSAVLIELMSRKTTEELVELKNDLEDSWK